jgi:hypothetical protein
MLGVVGWRLEVWTVYFSEMLVCAYKSTWRYNPEDQHSVLHCHENLKLL